MILYTSEIGRVKYKNFSGVKGWTSSVQKVLAFSDICMCPMFVFSKMQFFFHSTVYITSKIVL